MRGGARAVGLVAGVVADAAFGDPRRGHPVALFGRAAATLERRLWRDSVPAGALFCAILTGAAVAAGSLAERAAVGRHVPARRSHRAGAAWLALGWHLTRPGRFAPRSPGGTPCGGCAGANGVRARPDGRVGSGPGRTHRWLGVGEAVVVATATWAVLGGTSLAREGQALARSLEAGDLEAARARIPHLCARDPALLDAAGMARAGVESLAENTSDAVVAPLFWGAVAGVPGLLGYRAANTLDAMVGYRSPRYRRFGRAAARLDDVLNLVPARLAAGLTVLLAPVVGGSSAEALRAWRRDASGHPSPNAGPVEATAAGALGLRLGGRTAYAHGAEERPTLGDGRAPDAADLRRAVRLSRLLGRAALAVVVAIAWVGA